MIGMLGFVVSMKKCCLVLDFLVVGDWVEEVFIVIFLIGGELKVNIIIIKNIMVMVDIVVIFFIFFMEVWWYLILRNL